MRCEDVLRALPLTVDADEGAIRVHASGCPECGELLAAYEADAEVLSAYRAATEPMPAVMDGFADAVMAAVAAEPRLAAAPEPEGVVLKPAFGGMSGLVALAAMTLLAIGLGIVLSAGPGEPAPVADKGPAPVAPTAPVVAVADAEPLPAPRREAPMPLRRRGRAGIGVPVDGGRAPQLPSGPLFDVLRDVQRAFPGGFDARTPQRVPPLRPGEREVRF
jgi:hypothetical protein